MSNKRTALSVKQHAIVAALFTILTLQTALSAVLTHRYSFGSDATDSVGGADGTLLGAAFITNGFVSLNGSNSFVQLPNDLLTNYDSISLEAWFIDVSNNTANSQVFTFSGTNGSLSYQLDGRGTCVSSGVVQGVSLLSPAVGRTNHLIWTIDNNAQTAALYVNGALAAQNTNFTLTPARIGSTTNDYLGGCGKVTTVSNLSGGILEFRIYQGALTPLEAALQDALGPDRPQADPGALQTVRVAVPTSAGPGAVFRADVYANFANVSNVNISTLPDLVMSSDNTSVIAVAPDQRLQTLALGTANITASWQGVSTTVAVTVGVPQDIALIHRYSFNEQTNDWIVHDSIGGAHGRLFNTGSYSPTNAVFTGKGEMRLSGGISTGHGGYAGLPPGMISGLSEVTLEAWVTWTRGPYPPMSTGAWQRIFDFGSQSGDQGISYLYLTAATDASSYTTRPLLHAAITTNLNINETPRLNWTNNFPPNLMAQVAVTYSPVRGLMKMYLNGVPIASGTATIPLSGIVDTNCWLGKSQFLKDADFYGSYNEFRIYRGLMSDSDIAADFAAGPDAVGVDYVLHTFPSTNSMSITWGPSATNVVLQSSPVLDASTAWTPVAATPVLQNGRYGIIAPLTNDAAFFRLHAP